MFWRKQQETNALDVHAEIAAIVNEGRTAVKGFHQVSGVMIVMTAIGALLAMQPKVFYLLFPWPWLATAVDVLITAVILYGGVVALRAAGRSIRNARSMGEKPELGDRVMQFVIMSIEAGSFSYFLLMSAGIIPPIDWVNSLLTISRGIMLPVTMTYLEGQRTHSIGADDILHVATAAAGEIAATKLVDCANNPNMTTWEISEILLTIGRMTPNTQTRLTNYIAKLHEHEDLRAIPTIKSEEHESEIREREIAHNNALRERDEALTMIEMIKRGSRDELITSVLAMFATGELPQQIIDSYPQLAGLSFHAPNRGKKAATPKGEGPQASNDYAGMYLAAFGEKPAAMYKPSKKEESRSTGGRIYITLAQLKQMVTDPNDKILEERFRSVSKGQLIGATSAAKLADIVKDPYINSRLNQQWKVWVSLGESQDISEDTVVDMDDVVNQ